jgi:hypothetical protein
LTTSHELEDAQAVADALLYEGYLLYPYRRSSPKNRIRFQFGVLVPPSWARAQGLNDNGVAGSAESWFQSTECLVERGEAVRVRLRFLQLQRRSVEEPLAGGGFRAVDWLQHGDRTEVGFDEAVPREFEVDASLDEDTHRFRLFVEGGEDTEPWVDADRTTVGRIRRRRSPLSLSVTVTACATGTPFPTRRLRIQVENTTPGMAPDAPRENVLARSLLATHTLLRVTGGSFVSLLDPPEWAAAEARACRNVHTFPVLVGSPGSVGIMLSSPIILYDYPRVAPESPGDLHDATEIDEILTLRTLTLADSERREARATDPRASAILDRVESMPADVLNRLHGAIRELRPATTFRAGTRVRLRPRRRGTDAHDMFLAGRTARVEQVLEDVDGTTFLAVAVDDDPGADLHQWYGRLRHYRCDEVEPLS